MVICRSIIVCLCQQIDDFRKYWDLVISSFTILPEENIDQSLSVISNETKSGVHALSPIVNKNII